MWKLQDVAEVIEIDLNKYFCGKKVSCSLAYPKAIATDFVYNKNANILSVRTPKDRTARFFEINVI